jgi:UDP-N-acetylmuramyl tripeptide synthase
MLVEALGGPAEVATNSEGANMGAGLVAALSRRPDARIAVLEVDELHLPGVVRQVDPEVLVLLNLSRDQLDRMSEVRTVAQHVHDAVEAAPAAVVVANADDVLVVDAVGSGRQVVWVAGGSAWQLDSSACPSCGAVVHHLGDEWWCTCGLRRPGPRWTASETDLVAPDGLRVPLRIALPGAANRGNAAMAVAAAARLGTDPQVAALRVARVREVDGRYRTVSRGAREVTMLLAKNPAGWAEALTMLDRTAGHVVVAVNGQGPDGRDLSWLWDVAFEELRGRPVSAAGERCADLAVRLTYADLPHLVRRDPVRAIDDAPPGRVTVLANYTAFTALRQVLSAPAA